jgi:opacity protein-like surface antigen
MSDRLRNAALRNAVAGLLVGTATAVISTPARADNLLGLYIGGGVGESHVRNDFSAFSNVSGFVENHTGWKALIGVRPIPIVGAELEYTDFGHPGLSAATSPIPGLVYNADVSQRAGSLFGLVYWPLPILDLYAKAGLSELHTSLKATVTCPTCASSPISLSNYSQDSTTARFAYGAGAQVKLFGLAARAEYEQINAPGGSPDLYSLILTWTF